MAACGAAAAGEAFDRCVYEVPDRGYMLSTDEHFNSWSVAVVYEVDGDHEVRGLVAVLAWGCAFDR